MSQREAKQMLLIALLVSGVMASYHVIQRGDQTALPRVLFALLISGFFLSVLAQFAPEIAGPFAALLLVVAIFGSGNAIDQISKLTKLGGE